MKELFRECSLSKRDPCWPPRSALLIPGVGKPAGHLMPTTNAQLSSEHAHRCPLCIFHVCTPLPTWQRGHQPTWGFSLANHHRHCRCESMQVIFGSEKPCFRQVCSLRRNPIHLHRSTQIVTHTHHLYLRSQNSPNSFI